MAICPTAPTAALITHDVFALTRNPTYLGMGMMLLGCAVFSGGLAFYGAAAAYFLVIDLVICRYEERKLLAVFGEQFNGYSRRVRRWV